MWAHTEQQSQAGFSSPCISQKKEIQRQVCLRQACQTHHKKEIQRQMCLRQKENRTGHHCHVNLQYSFENGVLVGAVSGPDWSKIISLFLSCLVINISEYLTAFLTSLLISGELFFMISPPCFLQAFKQHYIWGK